MPKTNKKVPVGALNLVQTGQANLVEFKEVELDGGEKERKLDMTVYSGKVIENHWWWGNLAIDGRGAKFSHSKYPVLEEHNLSKKIGFSGKPVIDQATGKVTLNPDTTKFLDNDVSRDFQDASAKGFPYQASISVQPMRIEHIEKGASAEVNGFSLKGPGTIFREWNYREASVCVFGADSRTSSTAFSEHNGEEVELSLDEYKTQNNSIGEEESDMPADKITLESLTETNPDLVKQIQDKATAELSDEIAGLKDDNVKLTEANSALKEANGDMSGRLDNLELAETKRQETAEVDKASEIIDTKLTESTIPDEYFSKVKDQNSIAAAKFMADGKLDVAAFTSAVEAEIKSWEESGISSVTVRGGVDTFSKKVADSSNALTADQEKESADLADDLADMSGFDRTDK